MKPMKWILFTLMIMVAFSMTQAENTYVGVKKCKMCHKLQYTSWAASKHAQAFDLLKGDDQSNPVCLGCHATNKTADMPGVQCEACHGPGSAFKKMSVMKNEEAAIAAGLILPKEDTCLRCHKGAPHDQKEFVFAERIKVGVHEHKNK